MCMTETDQTTRPYISDENYLQRGGGIQVSSEEMLFTV